MSSQFKLGCTDLDTPCQLYPLAVRKATSEAANFAKTKTCLCVWKSERLTPLSHSCPRESNRVFLLFRDLNVTWGPRRFLSAPFSCTLTGHLARLGSNWGGCMRGGIKSRGALETFWRFSYFYSPGPGKGSASGFQGFPRWLTTLLFF